MGFDKFMYGILMFAAVITVGILMMQDLDTSYDDVDLDTSTGAFASIYNQSEVLAEDISGTSQDIQSTFGTDIDNTNTENSMFGGAFSALLNMGGLISLVATTITVVATEIGVPPIFIVISTAALGIFIAYGLILLIFRLRG